MGPAIHLGLKVPVQRLLMFAKSLYRRPQTRQLVLKDKRLYGRGSKEGPGVAAVHPYRSLLRHRLDAQDHRWLQTADVYRESSGVQRLSL